MILWRLKIKRYLFITAGITSLSVGIVGIFVPLLPTTPFLLLSAACFLRSSKSLYNWIINHKIFGKYIRNYLQFHAVVKNFKIISIIFLWLTIICSAVFFTNILLVRILLFLIAVGVTAHIVKLRTLTKEMIEKDETI